MEYHGRGPMLSARRIDLNLLWRRAEQILQACVQVRCLLRSHPMHQVDLEVCAAHKQVHVCTLAQRMLYIGSLWLRRHCLVVWHEKGFVTVCHGVGNI